MFDGLSIMTSFFAEFVHTSDGVTCSDSGLMDLSTEEECSGAVDYAKSFNSDARYMNAVSLIGQQKGCFIFYSGKIYFNTHPSGFYYVGKDTVTSICKKGNTYV